jgi:hypothetical protein
VKSRLFKDFLEAQILTASKFLNYTRGVLFISPATLYQIATSERTHRRKLETQKKTNLISTQPAAHIKSFPVISGGSLVANT